jgi:anti-sigma regulatory factor (Ser/Thr protein kinase)
MPKQTITFKLNNRLSELKTLNKKIDTFGVQVGIPNKCIFEIHLVLEELFTNITCYGYRDDKDHWVHVSISCENDIMTIQIEDDGIPFNPLEFEKPDFKCSVEDCEIGGLGIHLVKHYIKECVYERRGNKNILILKKTI